MNDGTKECANSDLCSVDLMNKLHAACLTVDRVNQTLAAGIAVPPEIIRKAYEAPARILEGLCDTYTSEAIRAGSIEKRHNLPQFFRNESGVESPGDLKVIAEMAAARGQRLNKSDIVISEYEDDVRES